ncbi:MAG: hypothetical protein D6814_01445 [Calditrichaeota bacterium]|nr:MAG: hypothetical protein D6814_01445 [Calditrichota bacterium]
MESAWEGKELQLKEIPQLYNDTAGKWLLLQILETNQNGTPVRLRMIAQSSDKSELHELIMNDDNWNWNHKYLLVFSDPNKPCTIR